MQMDLSVLAAPPSLQHRRLPIVAPEYHNLLPLATGQHLLLLLLFRVGPLCLLLCLMSLRQLSREPSKGPEWEVGVVSLFTRMQPYSHLLQGPPHHQMMRERPLLHPLWQSLLYKRLPRHHLLARLLLPLLYLLLSEGMLHPRQVGIL